MGRQKLSILMRIAFMCLLFAIIFASATPVATAHAASSVEEIEVLTKQMASIEDRLIKLEKKESNENGTDIEKIQALEQQMIILYDGIGIVSRQIEISPTKEQIEMEMAKTNELEQKREKNLQDVNTINDNMVIACEDVLDSTTNIVVLTDKIAALSKKIADDKMIVDELKAAESALEESMRLYNLHRQKLCELENQLGDSRKEIAKLLSSKSLIDSNNKSYLNGCKYRVFQDGSVWVNPCKYTRLASPFGYRIHPIYGDRRMHNGVDLTNSANTPIYATRSGIVDSAGWNDSCGYYVVLNHMDGYKSYYYHLSERSSLTANDVVVIGDQIGKMGTTGDSTGVHLHFGISYKGNYVDPMDYIR